MSRTYNHPVTENLTFLPECREAVPGAPSASRNTVRVVNGPSLVSVRTDEMEDDLGICPA